MYRILKVLRSELLLKEFCGIVHYLQIFLCVYQFKIKWSDTGVESITANKGKKRFILPAVLLIFYIAAVICKCFVYLTEYHLQEHIYNIPLFAVLVCNGLNNTVMFIKCEGVMLETFKVCEYVDNILRLKYLVTIDYKKFLLWCIVAFIYGSMCFSGALITYAFSEVYLQVAFHALAFVLATAQTILPLFYVHLASYFGYKKCCAIEKIIQGLDDKETSKTIAIERLNDIIYMNFEIVSSVTAFNRISRMNLVGILYLVLFCSLSCVVAFPQMGFYPLKEIFLLDFILLFVFVATIVVFDLFQSQQSEIINAIVDMQNFNQDEEVVLLRKLLLQQILHHQIDMTAYGMVTLDWPLILVLLDTLSTMSMFMFQMFPVLLQTKE